MKPNTEDGDWSGPAVKRFVVLERKEHLNPRAQLNGQETIRSDPRTLRGTS